MANVEATEVEQQLNGRLVYRIRVSGSGGVLEFPISVQHQAAAGLDETTALRNSLALLEQAAAQIRVRLD